MVWAGPMMPTMYGGVPYGSGPHDYTVVFQPTQLDNQGFRMTMKIQIKYHDYLMPTQTPTPTPTPGATATPTPEPTPDPNNFLQEDDYPNPYVLDPVYMVTGNLLWSYTDYALHGGQPLEFTRHYNAQDPTSGELGYGWRHNYSASLKVTQHHAVVTREDGYRYIYEVDISGGIIQPAHIQHGIADIPIRYLKISIAELCLAKLQIRKRTIFKYMRNFISA